MGGEQAKAEMLAWPDAALGVVKIGFGGTAGAAGEWA
jgi:hypothetical protein